MSCEQKPSNCTQCSTNEENNIISAAFPSESDIGPTINDCCASPFINVNNLLSFVSTYKKLNTIVSNMVGIDVVYFRSLPQERSKDVIFREYTLYNVSDPIVIKCISENGAFNDKKIDYEAFGLQYDAPVELNFDKTIWEQTVGKLTAPQQYDILYIPIANKIYEVISMTKIRGFMEQETGYKISLKTYNPTSSRSEENNALFQSIKDFTVSDAELLGDQRIKDTEDVTNKQQISGNIGTTLDLYKYIDNSTNIVGCNLVAYRTLYAKSYYDLSSSLDPIPIKYNIVNESILPETGISTWFNIRENDNNLNMIVYNISKISTGLPDTYYYTAIFEGTNKFEINKSYMLKYNEDICLLIDIYDIDVNSKIVYFYINDDIVSDIEYKFETWLDTDNEYKVFSIDEIYFVSNLWYGSGYRISIINNRIISFMYNTSGKYLFLDKPLQYDKWYNLICNIDNTNLNVEYYIWETNNESDNLNTFFNNNHSIIEEVGIGTEYHISRSNCYMTNIKVFNNIIDYQSMQDEILTHYINHSSKSIILDSADINIKTEYKSRPV